MSERRTKKLVIHAQLMSGQTHAHTAGLLLGREMHKIRRQFQRIKSHLPKLEGEPTKDENRSERLSMLFGDIHYLLISVKGAWRFFELICQDLGNEPELRQIRKKYSQTFLDAGRFRNRLEHIDDWVKKGTLGLGDVRGTVFTFDGRSLDFGANFEAAIEEFYRETKSAFDTITERKGVRGTAIRTDIRLPGRLP